MEFKISESSESKLKKMIQDEKEEQRKFFQERLEKHRHHKDEFGFKNAAELIDWVLKGNVVVHEDDPLESIYLSGEMVKIITMKYDDIDTPLGYGYEYKSIEEFKNWVRAIEAVIEKDGDDFKMICWEKAITEED